VTGEFLGAGDHARGQRSRQAQLLLLVKVRVLKAASRLIWSRGGPGRPPRPPPRLDLLP
jgi:hypothetical protein